jgi:type IX secretion system PorP/SprF family membrane protein
MKKLYSLKTIGLKLFFSIGILFLIFCFADSKVNAQEQHFTQFDYSPLVTNPANTGNFNGDWRVALNFRNQWQGLSTPFRTAAVSFDKQMYILNQRFGAGLYLLNDQSGDVGLQYNKIFGSIGYSGYIDNHLIGIGLQVGYVSGKIGDWNIFNYETGQHDLPSGEPNSDGSSSYLDFNFGVNYKTSVNIVEPEIGLSLFHLNKPSTSFVEGITDSENEALGIMAYTMFKLNFSDAYYLTPKFMLSQKASYNRTILGLEAGYNIVGNRTTVKRIFGGAYINNGIVEDLDAFAFQIGTTVNRIDLALNYSLTTSDLSNYGSMGSFEISLIYKSISTVLNSYSIPCERY